MRKLTARALPRQLPGYPDYLAALLHARGITTPADAARYLHPSMDQLHDPLLMHGMAEAVRVVHQAASEGLTCVVYGDYDADGVCASAILLSVLERLRVRAFSYIPARQSEGYGLNAQAVETLAGQAGLLISVDCGITALEEVARARALGMRVVITDHHSLPEALPQADALVHPHLGDYPDRNLCGAGVAWKLACALLGDAALDLLDLVALATVADLVPLKGENRVLVSLGLKALAETRRPGLKALMKAAGLREGQPVQSDHVAYQLAPRLNAVGRLSTAQDALSLLMTDSAEEAARLANQLEQLNQERRAVEQQVLRAASGALKDWDFQHRRSIVIAGEGWNPGVVGLTAGKLAERWNYPAIVLTEGPEGLSGSGRSAGQVDLYAAIQACADLLTRYGGHRMAAGLSLPKEHLPAFVERFDAAVKHQLDGEDLIPETIYDTRLDLAQVSLETVAQLDQLAPFGQDNPTPVFLLQDLHLVTARAVGSDQAHLKLTVAQDGQVREGIAFSQGKALRALSKQVSLVGSVDRNEFGGRVSAQLRVRALLPGESAFTGDPLLQARALISAAGGQAEDRDGQAQVEHITELPPLSGTRGTLLVAYDEQTANHLHRRYPHLGTQVGQASDPRGFHTIVFCPDFDSHFAQFSRLVFADGLPSMYTAYQAARACRAAQVLAMPQSAALRHALAAITPTLEELRLVYRGLRSGQTLAFTQDVGKDLAALAIFAQLGLVALNEQGLFDRLLPMKRVDPEKSPLYRALTQTD